MRRAFYLIRLGFEWGGNIALFSQLGGFVLIGAVAAAVVNLPWPLALATFVGAFLIAASIVWAGIGAWRDRAKKQAEKRGPERRVGYLGREGSKGNLRRARFGKDLDIAIDNAGDVDAEEAAFSEG
jgi:membrane protein implicated in regulation of membrane protease activity